MIEIRNVEAERDAVALLLGDVEDWLAVRNGKAPVTEGMAIRLRAVFHLYGSLNKEYRAAMNSSDMNILFLLNELIHDAGLCGCQHVSLATDVLLAN